jgi:predicted amidophosphoribosyltransferase
MITCRKCGAEHPPGAKFCQMCAELLSMPVPSTGDRLKKSNSSLSTTVVFSMEPSEPVICSVCEAVNEATWAFCQQCGSKLDQPPVDEPVQEEVEPKQQAPYATAIHASQLVPDLKKASAGNVACPKCSQQVVFGAAFCHKCGASITSARTVAMSSLKAAPRPAPKGRLLLIVDGEATGDEFEIRGEAVVGRINGDITFPHDDYMSSSHARIAKRGDKFVLIDEDSRNGCFIRIKKEVEIDSGDFILLGKQLFRFEV